MEKPLERDVFVTDSMELYRYPGVITKSNKEVDRLRAGIEIANKSGKMNFSLRNAVEESGRALVNRIYFLSDSAQHKPSVVVTLMNPERKGNLSFERSVAAYKLLHSRLPKVSEGFCITPTLYGYDVDRQILVTEALEDNVSWDTPEPIVEGMLQSFIALSKINPNKESLEIFPFPSLEDNQTPRSFLDNTIKGRFGKFFVWLEELNQGNIGDSESESREYKEVGEFIKQKNIATKIEEELSMVQQKIENLDSNLFQDMPDVGLNTSDGNALNFLTKVDEEGNLVVGNIDFDGASFGSISHLVISAVWHPQNRQLFKGEKGKELKKQLLQNYVLKTGISGKNLEAFNLLVTLYKLKWCGTVAKNLATGRANWKQLYGGLYKTRAEFILKRELPLLLELLDTNEEQFKINDNYNLEYKQIFAKGGKYEVLTNPLTQKSPFGEYDRFVASEVNDPINYINAVNTPYVKHNIPYEFSAEELLAQCNPYLFSGTGWAEPLGDGYYLVGHTMRSVRTQGPQKTEYTFLTRDKETDDSKGGLIFAVGEKVVKPQYVPKIRVPEEVFQKFKNEIPSQLKDRLRNLTRVFSGLGKIISDLEVTGFEFVNQAEGFFTIVLAKLNNGRKITIKLNRESRVPEASTGVVYVPRTIDGKYLLVRQKRAIIPTDQLTMLKSKETLEAARGWISKEEHPLKEFAHEFGLKGGYILLEGAAFAQDYRTDSTNLDAFLIKVDGKTKSDSFPTSEGTDEFFEEVMTEQLTGEEIVTAIKNGIIRDAFSVYAFSLFMLRSTGELTPEWEQIADKMVYLRKEFVLQDGEYKYSIIEGPKRIGKKIAENLSNSSSARQVDEVNEVDLETLEKLNIYGVEAVPVSQAIVSIINGEYDAPTACALVQGFLSRGFLKYQPASKEFDRSFALPETVSLDNMR